MAFGILNRFRAVKEPRKLRLLLGNMFGNTTEAISYKEALKRIKNLRDTLINKPVDKVDRSNSNCFWLTVYILALYAQERMIGSMNDELIASDVPWEGKSNIPLISSTVGDAISYAERLKDPKDYFLKALLLSFSGWTLLSTEKKECACGNGKLREIPVDVLVNTNIQANPEGGLNMEFFIGVQSDDQEHLERHYSFKKQSVRDNSLIIIFSSGGIIFKDSYNVHRVQGRDSDQAEQFRANRMAEILEGLVSSFGKET